MGDSTHVRVTRINEHGNLETLDSFENLDSGEYF
jgi:hypothetical protein